MSLLDVLERSRTLGYLGPGAVARHVAHADAFLAAVPAAPTRVLDLGSGGGVPGLVLADAWPTTSFVLLDAQVKRTAFLARAVVELGWGDRVAVLTGRAEELGRATDLRAGFDVVVARSFARPAVTAECGAPFVQVGGLLLVAEPPEEASDRWPVAGLELLGLVDEGLVRAGDAVVRRLRVTAPVDARYPRRTGVPGRRPLF